VKDITNCLVAVETKEGTIKASYIHFDGIIESVGDTLYKQYNTIQLVNELTKYGYYLFLPLKPEPYSEIHYPKYHLETSDAMELYYKNIKNFNKPQKFLNSKIFLKLNVILFDYLYLFKTSEKQWFVNSSNKKFVLLKK